MTPEAMLGVATMSCARSETTTPRVGLIPKSRARVRGKSHEEKLERILERIRAVILR